MPSIYDDLFEDAGEGNKKRNSEPKSDLPDPDDIRFEYKGKESLDEILSIIEQFTEKAEPFSRLLTRTRAVDHEVEKGILDFFLITKDKYDQGSLAAERKYYEILQSKFSTILIPMRELAQLHLQTVKQFNRDIDGDYYSLEKTERQVKSEKETVITNINIQRKILGEAATSLSILEEALASTEQRLRTYINAGGINNISNAECEILSQKRIALTDGHEHHFDYTFFKINLLDKTAIAMGMYLKETTSQYLNKLHNAFIKS